MKKVLRKKFVSYWKKQSKNIFWYSFPSKILTFNKLKERYDWYTNGKTNVCYNCLDKHVNSGLGSKTAIHEINASGLINNFTYSKLLKLVDYFSLFLIKNFKKRKLTKVMIHSSASLESAVSMLSCCRLGLTHNVIFEDLEKEAIEKRINLFKPDVFISKTNLIKFKKVILPTLKKYKKVKLIYFTDKKIKLSNFYKINIRNLDSNHLGKVKTKCKKINSQKNLFVLFTSGSTGQPKGIIHSTGGYLTFTKYTCKNNFGMNQKSIVLTASDAGWINGHTYALFGPLSFGATTILVEKPPMILNENILNKIIYKLNPTIVYLPVTLIRILKSLRSKKILNKNIKTLGSMGEPLAPEVAKWFASHFNLSKKTIVNTYFQTETGGIITSPKYNDKVNDVSYGSVGKPEKIFRIKLRTNKSLDKKEIVISNPWPGCMIGLLNGKKIWRNYWHRDKSFRLFDSGIYDKKNNLVIHGRTDDVINIRGHRIGSAEIESTLLQNKNIIEVCAVTTDDFLEGSVLNIFVVTKENKENISNIIKKILVSNFGSYAIPKKIFIFNELPKTRSGKILRRLLRDLILNKKNLGDLSTMINKNKISQMKKIIKKS